MVQSDTKKVVLAVALSKPSSAQPAESPSQAIRVPERCESLRSHRSMRIISSCSLLFVLIACGSAVLGQTATLAKLEAQYQTEMNAVRKAKLLAKLGPLEVDEALRNLQADQDDMALARLSKYRDDARSNADALSATEADPARHPAGFKELQIGLRESLRRLNDLLAVVPSDEQPQFEAVRSDLSGTQNSLIEALFPSPKGKRGKNDKGE
jgi:hypothetical protein